VAWSRLQSTPAAIGTGSNPAATFGTNLSSGTKLIAFLSLSTSNATTPLSTNATLKDGAGNTMTFLGGITTGSFGPAFVAVYAMDTPAGDVGTKPTITATINASVNDFGTALIVQEVSGLLAGNTTAMIDGSVATTFGTGTTATTAAYSSTAANEYLVGVYGDPGNTVTVSTPSGYTADANNVASNGNAQCCIFYKNSSNGAESASETLGASSTGWGTLLVAFKLAAAGPAFIAPKPLVVSQAVNRAGTY
jgi:hypothetical protein